MPKQIIVEVDEQGDIHFETDGFIGSECIEDDVVNYVKAQLGKGRGPDFKPIFYKKNQKKVIHKNLCG